MTTLKEIARLARVSPASVSSVLTENPNIKLSEKTRSRILGVVQKTGYIHKKRATIGRDTKPFSIAVFSWYPLSNPMTSEILIGIELALISRGGRMHVSMTEESVNQICSGNSSLLSGIHGAIFLSRLHAECAKLMRERGLPIVIVGAGSYYDDFDMVYVDPLGYARVGLKYLRSLGHKRIAMVIGGLPHYSYEISMLVLRDYLTENFPEKRDRYLRVAESEEQFRSEIKSLLALKDRPTAILGQCQQAVIVAEQLGLNIPGELSILTYDCPGSTGGKPLSYVGADNRELGRIGVEVLQMRRQHPERPCMHYVLPPGLHENGTCSHIG